MKDVLMDAPYEGRAKRNWFYPLYDKNDNSIIGTQWLPTENFFKKKPKNTPYFVLKNAKENEFTNKTILVKSTYKHYQ